MNLNQCFFGGECVTKRRRDVTCRGKQPRDGEEVPQEEKIVRLVAVLVDNVAGRKRLEVQIYIKSMNVKSEFVGLSRGDWNAAANRFAFQRLCGSF